MAASARPGTVVPGQRVRILAVNAAPELTSFHPGMLLVHRAQQDRIVLRLELLLIHAPSVQLVRQVHQDPQPALSAPLVLFSLWKGVARVLSVHLVLLAYQISPTVLLISLLIQQRFLSAFPITKYRFTALLIMLVSLNVRLDLGLLLA